MTSQFLILGGLNSYRRGYNNNGKYNINTRKIIRNTKEKSKFKCIYDAILFVIIN
ncbi:hypothetical protein Hanom_Chr12g01082821 [Helianthus anomalus]